MINGFLKKILFARITKMKLHEIIKTHQDPVLWEKISDFIFKNIKEFKTVLDGYKGTHLGGLSIAEAFWLYFLLKDIKPKQIIESGTFYGFSLYFIKEAAKSFSTKIISFDIDQTKSQKYPEVEYYSHDWMDKKDLVEGESTFVFFDDHMDQDKRLQQAFLRNQEHILFHDNYLSLTHSHKPIRFCDMQDAIFCYTFLPLYNDSIFVDKSKNNQTYRWLTYVQRPVGVA